jgi:NAD-dependent dihydropyrimidine dehydrogenase PreA subunit
MAKIAVAEKGCRGCTLCGEICPVKLFEFHEGQDYPAVVRQEDCIGCLSCFYICPSRCIEVSDVETLRPFHRIEGHAALVEKFLQEKLAVRSLAPADLDEAYKDVSARLVALSGTIVELLGTGYKAVGRQSGTLAAAHLPEVYDEKGLEHVLSGMQRLFRGAFAFDYSVAGEKVELTFHPCGLCQIVEGEGWKVGDAVLCSVFHEFWVGLLSAFAGKPYRYQVPAAGASCKMELQPAK